MSSERHLEQIIQRLQQRFVTLGRCAVGLDALFGGVAVGFVATLVMTLYGWPVAPVVVYGAIAVVAALVFAYLAWKVRLPALDALVRADQVLRFRERLSTAYEYQQHSPAHPFLPSLLTEAAKIAPRVEAWRVFPWRLPRRLWGIPVLLVATVSVTMLKVTPTRFDDLADQEATRAVVNAGQRLEKWGRGLEEVARREQLDRSMLLARQMQQLGQRLQREGGEKAQAPERIATLSQYLQRLRQELQERALMSDTGLAAARDVVVSGKSVKQELRDILQLLQNDAQWREMSAVAEQSLLRLSRQIGMNPELESLLQHLRAGDTEAARQMLRDALQQQQASEEVEHLERARQALEYSSRSIQRGSQNESASGRSRGAPEGSPEHGGGMFGDEMLSENMHDMEDFAAHGGEEGYGSSSQTRQPTNQPLRESAQPLSKVDVTSGEGSMRLSYVRYLPLQNAAQVPVEQAVVQYQHAAEEVLAQEQIPRAYREQIKQYFLSLGLVK